MAKLRALKLKSKEYVFRVFGNEKAKTPAKVVFKRFPAAGEDFSKVDRKRLGSGIDADQMNTDAGRKKAITQLLDNYLNNLNAAQTDYDAFEKNCIEKFLDFEYEDREITTLKDFDNIFPEARETILQDCYAYARDRDEFTMGESGA
jgi:hypothetical protein